MSRSILILILLALTGGAFARDVLYRSADKRPLWANKPSESALFYSFVGVSTGADSLEEGRRRALENIYQQVLSQLGIEITGVFSTLEEETNKVGKVSVSDSVSTKGTGKIEHLLVQDFYYEEYEKKPGQRACDYWVLARVPKVNLDAEEKRLGLERADAETKFHALMDEAAQARKSKKERLAWDKAMEALVTAKACLGSSGWVSEGMVFLRGTLAEIDLDPSNDGQVGDLQNGLPEPLVLHLTTGQPPVPVGQWPVAFTFTGSGGKLDGNVFTDKNGRAASTVRSFEKSDKAIEVVAGPDTKALLAGLAEKDDSRAELEALFAGKAVHFTMSAYGRQRQEMSQLVIRGDWTSQSVANVEAGLVAAGYNLNNKVIEKWDEWQDYVDPNTQWIVLLDGEIQQVSQTDGLYIAKVEATITLKQIANDKSAGAPITKSFDAKGGALDRHGAVNKAFDDAAEQIKAYIQTDFP